MKNRGGNIWEEAVGNAQAGAGADGGSNAEGIVGGFFKDIVGWPFFYKKRAVGHPFRGRPPHTPLEKNSFRPSAGGVHQGRTFNTRTSPVHKNPLRNRTPGNAEDGVDSGGNTGCTAEDEAGGNAQARGEDGKYHKICASCGAEFTSSRGDARFCSAKCASREYYKTRERPPRLRLCRHCGSEFVANLLHRHYCSEECRINHYSGPPYRGEAVVRLCAACGKMFSSRAPVQNYCSDKCRLNK